MKILTIENRACQQLSDPIVSIAICSTKLHIYFYIMWLLKTGFGSLLFKAVISIKAGDESPEPDLTIGRKYNNLLTR